MAENFPHPIPNGWFQVAFADELPTGALQTVHDFDQDLLLFPTEDGVAGAANPWCPHLSAHLGRTLEQPMLCDYDGPIPKARGWMRQFCSEPA